MKFHCFYREQNRAYTGQLTPPAAPLLSLCVCSKLSFQTHETPSVPWSQGLCFIIGQPLVTGTTSCMAVWTVTAVPNSLPCPFLCASPPNSPLVNRKPSVFHRFTLAGCFSHQGVTCFALDDKIPWNRILLSQSWILLPSIWWLKLGDTWPGMWTLRRLLNASWSLCSPYLVQNVP